MIIMRGKLCHERVSLLHFQQDPSYFGHCKIYNNSTSKKHPMRGFPPYLHKKSIYMSIVLIVSGCPLASESQKGHSWKRFRPPIFKHTKPTFVWSVSNEAWTCVVSSTLFWFWDLSLSPNKHMACCRLRSAGHPEDMSWVSRRTKRGQLHWQCLLKSGRSHTSYSWSDQ